jgi:hypothetical protein
MRKIALVSLVLVALVVAGAEAQRRRGFGGFNLRIATPDAFDSTFQFCRLAFRENRYGDGGGWGVDYPRADINLSIRLSELTLTRVSMDGSGEPNHLIVQPTDDVLFNCPFVMMTEVGAAYLDETEAERLRTYLLKGGFLWADDFWGTNAWELWATELAKVLPPAQYPIRDLPLEHPIFRSMFEIKKVPQIPSINHWMGSGGGTSERYGDSATPTMRGVFDSHGRLMVLITHNTDVGDSWEREGDDPQYFYNFSVDGYALGINIAIYAMSH